MKTLCFGGSFNPIHHGHLICARAAAEAGGFDRVLLIPNARSPLKPDDPDWVPAEHRLRMCELAIDGDSFFEADAIELNRAPPSFTIDTVRELKRSRGWNEVYWLIGADTVEQLPRWHQPEELMRETRFVVMRRPGSPLPTDLPGVSTKVVDTPLINISATDIRRRARENRPIEYLTSSAVCDYIRAHRLYV